MNVCMRSCDLHVRMYVCMHGRLTNERTCVCSFACLVACLFLYGFACLSMYVRMC